MPTTLIRPERFAQPLDARQTARLLELAVRSQARVALCPQGSDEAAAWSGTIVAAAPESLCIALPAGATPPSTLISMCCEATLHLGPDRYVFGTNVMAVIDTDTPVRMEFARPDVLYATERRRFCRMKTRPSCSVRITQAGDAGCETGALFNVGMGGVACRIEREAADRLELGERVQVAFHLENDTREFNLAAVVRSKTPLDGQDRIILGMEFAFGESDPIQRRRLSEALGFPSATQRSEHDV
ncbi:MAG: PilZ domain-containing protein [Phycisphaerae bacterium]|nr:PilZ domain-containing protein [Phycisphaerae bacterium]